MPTSNSDFGGFLSCLDCIVLFLFVDGQSIIIYRLLFGGTWDLGVFVRSLNVPPNFYLSLVHDYVFRWVLWVRFMRA